MIPPASIECVLLALGSNLGDRRVHLRRAVAGLGSAVHVVAVSSVWESEPLGCRDGAGAFLNIVLAGWTRLSPESLLESIAAVERAGGRRRRLANDTRTIDVDIVFFGNRRLRQAWLTIPHPRFRERNFVLQPMREIAGAIRIPSFEADLRGVRGEGEARRWGPLY